MKISLRRGEKIYINGAVFNVDRKVCIELLNDVNFLLENHVMQPSDATTPLKQLYFVVQTMLMSPNDTKVATDLFDKMTASTRAALMDRQILNALEAIERLVAEGRWFEALKTLRAQFPAEDEILVTARKAVSKEQQDHAA